ncbi:urease accessory protein UreD [Ramlibacter sp. AN1015]|uniref:urease accessory protein UreD n=1 Tax=Ramlibacter sp. AN1015 TaxID=3133428 RepID=UPI0030BD4F68
MSWHARLQVHYENASGRTRARFEHEGPLRILQSLYPEGDAICHNVVVHPPSGLVAGDRLDIEVDVDSGAHGLVTTPGATRFYRSTGEVAVQSARITLQPNARLEWLPLETLCYSGCRAENRVAVTLASGAELMGWDLTALGLPAAGRPFVDGSVLQQVAIDGVWLERGIVRADDHRLMDGPLGLAGNRCLATLYFAAGDALPRERRTAALELARELIEAHPLAAQAGATAPHERVLVLRVLSPLVEPAMDLLTRVRNAWRMALWSLPPSLPRTWAL